MSRRSKNHTPKGVTSPYNLYLGVTPHPPRVSGQDADAGADTETSIMYGMAVMRACKLQVCKLRLKELKVASCEKKNS